MVQPLFVTKSKNPLRTFRKLAAGEWPLFDAKGKAVDWQKWDNQACAYICEGLTSFSEQLLEFLRENHLFLREQKADAAEVGGEKIAAASQTAYNVAQMEMFALLKGFANIPNIERVLWSAHEVSAVEEGTGMKMRGPALVGSAKTPHVQKYIGTLLHCDEVTVEGVRLPRIYFVRHPDARYPEVSYPAKVTLPPEARELLAKTYPHGYFDPTLAVGLDSFLTAEAYALRKATSDLAAWKKNVDSLRAS